MITSDLIIIPGTILSVNCKTTDKTKNHVE